MKYDRLWRAFLFPHIALMIILTPISVAFLVYSMVFIETDTVPAIISYVIAAYMLTVWCIRIPRIITFFKSFKNDNKYARMWQDNPHLRVTVSLYGSLILNTAYAVFQMGLGFYHASFWFFSMSAYYIFLAVMRFFLLRYTRQHTPGEHMEDELRRYRFCGVVFLIMNLALTLMIFFMVYWNRTFIHHEITTIAMSAYTFTAFTVAVVNIVKYRKYNSPVYSASKAISLAAASVSMLTLESTMLTTFGKESMNMLTRRIFLAASGGVISVFIVAMAIYMIVKSSKKMKYVRSIKEE